MRVRFSAGASPAPRGVVLPPSGAAGSSSPEMVSGARGGATPEGALAHATTGCLGRNGAATPAPVRGIGVAGELSLGPNGRASRGADLRAATPGLLGANGGATHGDKSSPTDAGSVACRRGSSLAAPGLVRDPSPFAGAGAALPWSSRRSRRSPSSHRPRAVPPFSLPVWPSGPTTASLRRVSRLARRQPSSRTIRGSFPRAHRTRAILSRTWAFVARSMPRGWRTRRCGPSSGTRYSRSLIRLPIRQPAFSHATCAPRSAPGARPTCAARSSSACTHGTRGAPGAARICTTTPTGPSQRF